jgi:hypothetical protein
MEYPQHDRGGPLARTAWHWSSCIGTPEPEQHDMIAVKWLIKVLLQSGIRHESTADL